MDSQGNEDYWSSSAGKAFSFEEDEDTVDNNSLPHSRSIDVFNDDTISEASLSFESSAGAVINFTIKNVVSEEVLSTLLQEQSLDECVIPKGCPLEEELKLLRRQIQNTIYSPMPEVTALKLLQGKNPPLEVFKSLQEKEQLVDVVLQNGGGDAILGVLLFLKRSLYREKFYQILRKRPLALEHYVSFIKSSKNCKEETIDVLRSFGRHQEAVVIQFKSVLASGDLHMKKRALRELLDFCDKSRCNVNSLYPNIFHNTFKIFDFIEKEYTALDNMVSFNSTPTELLYACCQKHTNWKDTDVTKSTSPFRFVAEQKISAACFEWTALNERTSSQAYADLECIFERPSIWHPMKQKQFHISFSLEIAILRMYSLQAPSTVLYIFLSKISSNSEKLELSKRVNCKKATIDALAALKDFNQLTELRDNLPDRSEERFYCDKALKSLQNKRWTRDSIKLKL